MGTPPGTTLNLTNCIRIVVREFNKYDDLLMEYNVDDKWTPDNLEPDCDYFTVLTERKLPAIHPN